MSISSYSDCLDEARKFGLEIDPRIERKKVDGLYGMYALDDIHEGTELCSFPLTSCFPMFAEKQYAPNVTVRMKHIHWLARQIQDAGGNQFNCFTRYFDTYAELESCSVYFFNEHELQLLQRMSGLLMRPIHEAKHNIETDLKTLQSIDPKITTESAVWTILNMYSRAWDAYGIIPVLDLFNHSDEKGASIAEVKDKTRVAHRAKTSYQKGEQIFISYSPKDMYIYAIYYNFFDPTGQHFIDYGYRLVHNIPADFDMKIAEHIRSKYNSLIFELHGKKQYKIHEKGLMFMEKSPAQKLIDFLTDTAFQSELELNQKRAEVRSVARTLLYILQVIYQQNQVERFRVSELPEKLHRFYYMLLKEKTVVEQNIRWVKTQYASVLNK